jgi:hypothetical protein
LAEAVLFVAVLLEAVAFGALLLDVVLFAVLAFGVAVLEAVLLDVVLFDAGLSVAVLALAVAGAFGFVVAFGFAAVALETLAGVVFSEAFSAFGAVVFLAVEAGFLGFTVLTAGFAFSVVSSLVSSPNPKKFSMLLIMSMTFFFKLIKCLVDYLSQS